MLVVCVNHYLLPQVQIKTTDQHGVIAYVFE